MNWLEAQQRLSAEAQGALATLERVGGEAAILGRGFAQHLERALAQVAHGGMSQEAAERVLDRYLVALDSMADGAREAAEVEGLKRARTVLGILRDVGLGFARLALISQGVPPGAVDLGLDLAGKALGG